MQVCFPHMRILIPGQGEFRKVLQKQVEGKQPKQT